MDAVEGRRADLVEGRNRGWDQMAAIRDEFVGHEEGVIGGLAVTSDETAVGARMRLTVED